jgi:hypothetical protein
VSSAGESGGAPSTTTGSWGMLPPIAVGRVNPASQAAHAG